MFFRSSSSIVPQLHWHKLLKLGFCFLLLFLLNHQIVFAYDSRFAQPPPPFPEEAPVLNPPPKSCDCPPQKRWSFRDRSCRKRTKRSSLSLNLGAGFSSTEHPILEAGVLKRNAFGLKGLDLNLETHLSFILRKVDFLAQAALPTTPWFWRLGFHAKHQSWQIKKDPLQLMAAGGRAGIGYHFQSNLSLLVSYKLEYQQLKNTKWLKNWPNEKRNWDDSTKVSSIKLHAEYHSRPKRIREMLEGFHFKAGIEHSSPVLASSYDHTKLDATARFGTYLPLGLHLTLETRGGVFFATSEDEIPVFSRYRFQGLDDSYGMPVISEVIHNQDRVMPIGGTGKAFGRAELRVPVLKRVGLYLVGTIEGGAILHGLSKKRGISWGLSPGVGMLWKSPIGPLRFSFNFPLHQSLGLPQTPVMFSFGLGL